MSTATLAGVINTLQDEISRLTALLKDEADLRREFRAEISDLRDCLERAKPYVKKSYGWRDDDPAWQLIQDIEHALSQSTDEKER